jgi:hypothetical protein
MGNMFSSQTSKKERLSTAPYLLPSLHEIVGPVATVEIMTYYIL